MSLFNIRQYSDDEETELRKTHLIKNINGLDVVMGEEEEKAIRDEWAANEAAQKQADFLAQVTQKLVSSNNIVIEAYEKGLPMPESWKSYRQSLRDLLEKGAGDIPAPPVE